MKIKENNKNLIISVGTNKFIYSYLSLMAIVDYDTRIIYLNDNRDLYSSTTSKHLKQEIEIHFNSWIPVTKMLDTLDNSKEYLKYTGWNLKKFNEKELESKLQTFLLDFKID